MYFLSVILVFMVCLFSVSSYLTPVKNVVIAWSVKIGGPELQIFVDVIWNLMEF